MMLPRRKTIAMALLVAVAVVIGVLMFAPLRVSVKDAESITDGMSRPKVIEILGVPDGSTNGVDLWQFPDGYVFIKYTKGDTQQTVEAKVSEKYSRWVYWRGKIRQQFGI